MCSINWPSICLSNTCQSFYRHKAKQTHQIFKQHGEKRKKKENIYTSCDWMSKTFFVSLMWTFILSILKWNYLFESDKITVSLLYDFFSILVCEEQQKMEIFVQWQQIMCVCTVNDIRRKQTPKIFIIKQYLVSLQSLFRCNDHSHFFGKTLEMQLTDGPWMDHENNNFFFQCKLQITKSLIKFRRLA